MNALSLCRGRPFIETEGDAWSWSWAHRVSLRCDTQAQARLRELLLYEITLIINTFSQLDEGATHMQEEREDTTIYKVVVNHEEQYSIWPADRENALGWNDAGKTGSKEECLAYIKEVWTDMRPLSLRKKMEEAANKS